MLILAQRSQQPPTQFLHCLWRQHHRRTHIAIVAQFQLDSRSTQITDIEGISCLEAERRQGR